MQSSDTMPSGDSSQPPSERRSQPTGIAKLSSVVRTIKVRARRMPGSLIAGMVLLGAAFATIGTQQAIKLVSADGTASRTTGNAQSSRTSADDNMQQGTPADSQKTTSSPKDSTSSDSRASSESRTNISVNGQNVSVPENGTYSRTIHDNSGSTSVHVESRNSTTNTDDGASSSSSNNVTLRVHSESSSSNGEDSE